VKRDEFEHALRAAADILEDELVVVGSQAILGQRGVDLMHEADRDLVRDRLEGVLQRANTSSEQRSRD
jgi:hypothetical protein